MDKPVYEYLGYRALQIVYSTAVPAVPKTISLSIPQSHFDEEKKIYQFLIHIEGINEDVQNFTFRFVFQAAFMINDLKWKNDIKKNELCLESFLLPYIFPFIRQKIANITDDGNGKVILPVIDLRGADLKEGISFNL